MRRAVPLLALTLLLAAALPAQAGRSRPNPPPDQHEAVGFQTFTSPQTDPILVSPGGNVLYVANTTNGTVSILSTSLLSRLAEVTVGLEPVSLALKPDGTELWVSNHVSDSVSVVDVVQSSVTFGQVVETIQLLDANGVTLFDEPAGIAFASDSKAYVALSSRNQIAVVDATNYTVQGFIPVRAQEPRAIAVRGGHLYVAAFESGNQSQVSACTNISGTQCTLGLAQLINFASEPNLPNDAKNIVIDPQLASVDRDLFVYDTTTDQEIGVVNAVSTLLYGLAVDSQERVFLTSTDARNTVNGLDGDVLASLDNRMFDNLLSRVDCPAGSCGSPVTVNLEPGGTTHANALATPYGVAISGDDSLVLLTAAGSSRVASYDASLSGGVIDSIDVGSIPKGIAFSSTGRGGTAYVLNTLDNTVTKVFVDPSGILSLGATKSIGTDPTPPAVRRGRIAFSNAFASTSGNFSCESCHPDGNTDQLLWRIGGNCEPMGCAPGDEPRSTMPVRGLKNTLPLHWDGTLGDPFGGGSGEIGFIPFGDPAAEPPDCNPNDADGDHDCFLDLAKAALSGVMCDQTGSCPPGGNELSVQEQDDMAFFLASVSYPPARSRRIDDSLSTPASPADINGASANALQGFKDFFTDQGGNTTQPHTCADADGGCHALPLGASTNSPTLDGFDAPTMRGMTDRTLQFSLGVTEAREIMQLAVVGLPGVFPAVEPEIAWDPNQGYEEITTFGVAFGVFDGVYNVRPLNMFQMFEEASTGFSGATGRQVTLNTITANDPGTVNLMTALETADARGGVNLRAVGKRSGQAAVLSFRSSGLYESEALNVALSPAQLRAEAASGVGLYTLTADLRANVGATPQPLLDTWRAIGTGLIDDPPLPNITAGASNPAPFSVTGTDVSPSATVLVDGQVQTGGTANCGPGVRPDGFCINGELIIDLTSRPANGTHLLQVQNPSGLLSNELPICIGSASGCI